MKIELHRTNYNSSEAQNLTEQSTDDSKHIINFSEFSSHKTEAIKLTNLAHI